VRDILEAGEGASAARRAAARRKVLVEFVSANPTGPLHVGHGRGAAYGGSLCKLLAFAGWEVTSEYYVNDAGRQMDILALSTWLRYLELCQPIQGASFRRTPIRATTCATWPADAGGARRALSANGEPRSAGTPGCRTPCVPTPKPRNSARRTSMP
jgi:hypothetical protein